MLDLGTIFLFLALFIFVAIFVARPVVEKRSVIVSELEQDRSALLAERDRLLNAIQELDFDHSLGKVPQEDYPAQRQRLLQRGAAVLRRLDAAMPAHLSDDDLDRRLEEAVADRRAQEESEAPERAGPGAAPTALAEMAELDDIEKLIAARREARDVKAVGFCAECGNPLQETDRFCARCGAVQKTV